MSQIGIDNTKAAVRGDINALATEISPAKTAVAPTPPVAPATPVQPRPVVNPNPDPAPTLIDVTAQRTQDALNNLGQFGAAQTLSDMGSFYDKMPLSDRLPQPVQQAWQAQYDLVTSRIAPRYFAGIHENATDIPADPNFFETLWSNVQVGALGRITDKIIDTIEQEPSGYIISPKEYLTKTFKPDASEPGWGYVMDRFRAGDYPEQMDQNLFFSVVSRDLARGKLREDIAKASGTQQFFAGMAADLVDPFALTASLVTGGLASEISIVKSLAKGGLLARSAGRMITGAAYGVGFEIPKEFVKQVQDPTRTQRDVLLDLSTAALVTAGLSTGLGALADTAKGGYRSYAAVQAKEAAIRNLFENDPMGPYFQHEQGTIKLKDVEAAFQQKRPYYEKMYNDIQAIRNLDVVGRTIDKSGMGSFYTYSEARAMFDAIDGRNAPAPEIKPNDTIGPGGVTRSRLSQIERTVRETQEAYWENVNTLIRTLEPERGDVPARTNIFNQMRSIINRTIVEFGRGEDFAAGLNRLKSLIDEFGLDLEFNPEFLQHQNNIGELPGDIIGPRERSIIDDFRAETNAFIDHVVEIAPPAPEPVLPGRIDAAQKAIMDAARDSGKPLTEEVARGHAIMDLVDAQGVAVSEAEANAIAEAEADIMNARQIRGLRTHDLSYEVLRDKDGNIVQIRDGELPDITVKIADGGPYSVTDKTGVRKPVSSAVAKGIRAAEKPFFEGHLKTAVNKFVKVAAKAAIFGERTPTLSENAAFLGTISVISAMLGYAIKFGGFAFGGAKILEAQAKGIPLSVAFFGSETSPNGKQNGSFAPADLSLLQNLSDKEISQLDKTLKLPNGLTIDPEDQSAVEKAMRLFANDMTDPDHVAMAQARLGESLKIAAPAVMSAVNLVSDQPRDVLRRIERAIEQTANSPFLCQSEDFKGNVKAYFAAVEAGLPEDVKGVWAAMSGELKNALLTIGTNEVSGDIDGQGGAYLSYLLLSGISELMRYGLENAIGKQRSDLGSNAVIARVATNQRNSDMIKARLVQRMLGDIGSPQPTGRYTPDNGVQASIHLALTNYMANVRQQLKLPGYSPTQQDVRIVSNTLPLHDLHGLKRMSAAIERAFS